MATSWGGTTGGGNPTVYDPRKKKQVRSGYFAAVQADLNKRFGKYNAKTGMPKKNKPAKQR